MANIDIAAPGASATSLRSALALQGAGAIAQSAVAQSVTGTLTETTLATITIPASALGANGQAEIVTLWSVTNSANNKTLKIKFGGSLVLSTTLTTTSSDQIYTRIANRNGAASQVSQATSNSNGFGTSGTVTTLAIDTTADVPVVITGTLANTGETITLESYIVKIYPKA